MTRVLTVIVLALLMVAPTLAQDTTVVADGLLNPRNLAFDPEGNLYVAEAGVAGPLLTDADVAYGNSSQISMIDLETGESTVVVHGLTSYREGNPLGASAVQVTDSSMWVLLAETSDFRIPFSHALVEMERETNRILTFADVLREELAADPDGNPNMQSNPTDFEIMDGGSVLIANAGCNCMMIWSPEVGVNASTTWDFETDNPVPTSVELGPDNDFYVGFLTGFPFPEGGSRIERYSFEDGSLLETFEGLTAVTGLEVTDDGTIYAVEFGAFAPESGWGPGRVVEVSADGITPVLEDLTAPYGIESGPDGTLYVSTNSLGGPDGQIIAIPTME